MNDVMIAPKRASLKPILVEATMFLRLNMNLIPNNLADVAQSPIWNTLIPSLLNCQMTWTIMKMKMMIMTMMMKMMTYHQCQSKVRKLTTRANFRPINFLVQQHENTEPTESNTTKYIQLSFISMDFSLV